MTADGGTPADALLAASQQALAGKGGGVLAGCAYLALAAFWMVVLGVATAVLILALEGPSVFAAGSDPAAVMAAMPGWVLGASTIVQFGGLLGAAVAIVWAGRWPWQDAFALRRPGAAPLVAAGIGGFVVGVFPGVIAERLIDLGLDASSLETINALIADGDLFARIATGIAVCVFAPLFEELVFRGFLFEAAERATNKWAAWIVTSALFASFHVVPVHVIAVFFTGLFLGWLRLRSGSVWPSVLAHAVNNGLAAAFALALGAERATVTGTPLWVGLLGALATLAMAGVATYGTVAPRTERA